jgi:membrane protein required for colicin V production
MNLLDLLLAAIVAASVIAGFRSGFTKATFGLIATIAGILLGFWFYDVPAAWYAGFFESKIVTYLLGFLTVFLAAIIAGGIAGRLFSAMFKAIGLKFADKLAGGLFGLVRGALLATGVVVMLLAATPRPSPQWMRGSVLLPYALDVSDWVASMAPPTVKTAVSDSINEIKSAWKSHDEKLPPPVEQ